MRHTPPPFDPAKASVIGPKVDEFGRIILDGIPNPPYPDGCWTIGGDIHTAPEPPARDIDYPPLVNGDTGAYVHERDARAGRGEEYDRRWYDGNGFPYPETGVGSDNSIAPWLRWCDGCKGYVAKPRCKIHHGADIVVGPAANARTEPASDSKTDAGRAVSAQPDTVQDLKDEAIATIMGFMRGMHDAIEDEAYLAAIPETINLAFRILKDL